MLVPFCFRIDFPRLADVLTSTSTVRYGCLCLEKENYRKSVMNKLIIGVDVFVCHLFLHHSNQQTVFAVHPFSLYIFFLLLEQTNWHDDDGGVRERDFVKVFLPFIELFSR